MTFAHSLWSPELLGALLSGLTAAFAYMAKRHSKASAQSVTKSAPHGDHAVPASLYEIVIDNQARSTRLEEAIRHHVEWEEKEKYEEITRLESELAAEIRRLKEGKHE